MTFRFPPVLPSGREKDRAYGTLSVLLLALLSCAPVGSASAWGPEGHRIVGEIASRYLNGRAAAQVIDLLSDDRLADGSPSGRKSLGEVANWADEIKDFEWGRRRGAWHYDDIPVCGSARSANHCNRDRCASAQIERQLRIVSSESARRRQRTEALKWLVHLVGDIHQPLHASNRGDRGGNLVQVSFFGERDNPPYGTLNLHALWDVHMVRRLITARGGERALVSAPVSERERGEWERGAPSSWILESHRIAVDFVYPSLPIKSTCPGKIVGVVEVGQVYYDLAAPVIERQLKKAGIRLAKVLNEALRR